MQNHTVPSEMRALVWLGPHQMELQTLPTPVPQAYEVLIKVGAVGICGSELSGYLGHNSLRVPPLIMGHEAAGTIVSGGGILADGTPVHQGQRVTFNPLVTCGTCDRCKAGRVNLCRSRKLLSAHLPGACAQYVVVPADLCWHLPEKISFTAGSLAEPLACAVHAVELADAQAGQSLLVLGAGPIGLCVIAAAKARGRGHGAVAHQLGEGRGWAAPAQRGRAGAEGARAARGRVHAKGLPGAAAPRGRGHRGPPRGGAGAQQHRGHPHGAAAAGK